MSYSIQNVTLITEARLFLAILTTFAVKNQQIYIFDVFKVASDNGNFTLTLNSGISPLFGGITSINSFSISQEFAYSYSVSGSPYAINKTSSISSVKWVIDSNLKASSNLFIFAKTTCLPFITENTKQTCTNTCSFNQTTSVDLTMNWRTTCSICIREKVCTRDQFCGDYVLQEP